MKLADLIASVTWDDVMAPLLWSYPDIEDSIEDHRLVFLKLGKLGSVTSDMRVVVRETFREEIDDAPFAEVVRCNGTLNREQDDYIAPDPPDDEYADTETLFSLVFRPWEEWLGMEIDPASLESYTGAQIVAHCLWEMTFHGFDQESIQRVIGDLKQRVDELSAMAEEEREACLIPFDHTATDDDMVIHRGPFKGKKIEFASTGRIEGFRRLAVEFMLEIFDFMPGEYLITDESIIHDFTEVNSCDTSDIWRRITGYYGVRREEVSSELLVDVFSEIQERKILQ